MLGEKANRFKARILSGKHGSRCGGYKCEGERALPGEICMSPTGQDAHRALRDRQKSAEVIVVIAHDEGPNLQEVVYRISECPEQMPRKRA